MGSRLRSGLVVGAVIGLWGGPEVATGQSRTVDLLLRGGRVIDGAGGAWVWADVGIVGDRIRFVGNAADAKIRALRTVDVSGRLITPGFWDAHNHENLLTPPGQRAVPFITQGVTTVVLGVDGFGRNDLAETFRRYRAQGIAVNALHFVGHGAARTAVMGTDFARAPTEAELERMKRYVAKGMDEGAVGFSTGLAYNPGYYSTTEEVIALNQVAARYGGIYDTHDRDMGVTFKGVGYLASVNEAIEIAERGGTSLIFSHFSSLGPRAHPLVPEAIRLIEAARGRGVNVMGAQHVYTASESSIDGHLLPRWAPSGGADSLQARLRDSATWDRMEKDIAELLEMRGGPDKIVITEGPKALAQRSLTDIARSWNVSATEAIRRMLMESPQARLMDMNVDIYSIDVHRMLAVKDWMMTCTDGYTPASDTTYTHPRTYAGFTRKLTQFARDEKLISLAFAIRSMTSLAASFFGVADRGLVKPGFYADLVVFDEAKIQDRATYQNPRQYSEGTVHVLVNGQFVLRDGKLTNVLAGKPIKRGGH